VIKKGHYKNMMILIGSFNGFCREGGLENESNRMEKVVPIMSGCGAKNPTL
jgi:hypothetical protein